MAKKSKKKRKQEREAKEVREGLETSQKKSRKRRRKTHAQVVAEEKERKRQRRERDSQRKTTIPVSRLTESELENWKERFQPIVDAANYRIQELHEKGLTTLELERFQRGDETKEFNIKDITDVNELRSTLTQIRVFLNDAGESDDKAFLETAMLSAELYRGQFGNEYQENKARFNLHDVVDEEGTIKRKAIDPDIASRAFRAYRRLEEEYAAVIGRQGSEGVYGSENLIIAIYDMESRGMDGQSYGKDLLESWMNEWLKEKEGVTFSLTEAEAMFGSWDDFINRRYF